MHKFNIGDMIRYVAGRKGQPSYRVVEVQEHHYLLEAEFPHYALFGVKLPIGRRKVECKLYKELAHGFYAIDQALASQARAAQTRAS